MKLVKLLNKTVEISKIPFFWVWSCFNSSQIKKNYDFEVDIIIPIIEKDLLTIQLTIDSIRKNIEHKIKNIYILAPENERILEFCLLNNLNYMNEDIILGYKAKSLNYILSDGTNRSGWVFQQLLKLSGAIGTTNHFIVIDSDHVLLKPHSFYSLDEQYIFYKSSEFHFQYYKMNKNLVGIMKVPFFSYVSHKMIFNKEILNDLKNRIEIQHKESKMRWDQIIISRLDNNELSCFSEFELYGSTFPKSRKIFLPWKQKTLKRSEIDTLPNLEKKYKNYWSVTLPSYIE